MTISAGMNWTGDLGAGAGAAAAEVDKLVSSLRALQSIRGGSGGGASIPGLGDPQAVGALGAAAKRAAAINNKSAADLAKVEAQRLATLDAINAKTAGALSATKAKGELSAQNAQQQQALVLAKAAAAQAATQNKAEAARLAALNAVIKNQAKASDDAYLAQVKGVEAAKRAAEAIALAEVQGAHKANVIREKAAADIARAQAKAAADAAKSQAKEAKKATAAFDPGKLKLPTGAKLATLGPLGFRMPKGARVAGMSAGRAGGGTFAEATTSGIGGAAKALLEGKGAKGAIGAYGGKLANVAAIGSSVFDAASDAIGILGNLSKRFGLAVIEAQAYREDVAEAFTVVARSAKDGDAVLQRALKTADRLGVSRVETTGQYLDLLTKGFDVDTIDRIVGSLRDLSTIDPSASMEGLTKVIGKVKATGRLNQETLNELSTFGLEQSDVIKEIGAITKKTDAEVLKALSSSGGIRGLGVEPILTAIQGQVGGGKAGDKMVEKSNRNLSSLMKRVTEIPANILFDVNAGPGIDNVKTILRDILSFFAAGSETAKEASRVIGNAFNSLISGLAGASKRGKSSNEITVTLKTLVAIIDDAGPALYGFGRGVNFAFQAAAGLVGLTGAVFGAAENFGTWIGNTWRSITSGFAGLGTNIIDGITGGISGGASRVIDAIKSVASGALASAKSVLGIASPSKEFARVGAWSAEGMAIGIEREAFGVSSAARLMADDARLSAQMRLPALTSGAVAAGGAMASAGAPAAASVIEVRLPPGPLVVVQAAPGADAASIAETLEPHVRRIFVDIMRQIRLEGMQVPS